MKLLPLCTGLALLSFVLYSHAQPTQTQLGHIATLVEEGKLNEARIRSETLLEVYPNDPALTEILRLLREKIAAQPVSGSPITPPTRIDPALVPPPVPEILTPSLSAWLGEWTAEATVDSMESPSGQIEENRYRVRVQGTLSVRLVNNAATISFKGECWADDRVIYTDGKNAHHLRRHMQYEIPGRLTHQDTHVSSTDVNLNLRNLDFDQALQAMKQPTFVANEYAEDTYTIKRHAFSKDYTTLTLWIGIMEHPGRENEVAVVFTLSPAMQSLVLSSDPSLFFKNYTRATVPAIKALGKVPPSPTNKP